LWAVVNNAGVYKGASAELSKLQDFKDCMDVNLIGMVRVTKAFLPFLRKSKGRVVNIASSAGRIAFPYITPYSVSKFAVVGFNECLRREMDVWGIRVISIEPELFRTPMADCEKISKHLDEKFASLDASIIEDYGAEYLKNFSRSIPGFSIFPSSKVFKVIKDLESAITLESPDAVYKTCRNNIFKIGTYILHNSPGCVQDLLIKLVLYLIRHPRPRKL
ncbi:Estradiol 17-beta-dehydrogenase 2, partial [Araneus ventricosus]